MTELQTEFKRFVFYYEKFFPNKYWVVDNEIKNPMNFKKIDTFFSFKKPENADMQIIRFMIRFDLYSGMQTFIN